MNDISPMPSAAGSVQDLGQRFLGFTADRPQLRRKAHFEPFFQQVQKVTPSVCGVPLEVKDPVQPWPVWIDPALNRELGTTAVGLTQLFRTLPQRFFGGDATAVADFLGLDATTVAMLLAEPHLLDQTLCRGDFLLTTSGPKLLELNLGNLGGWQFSALEALYLERPDVIEFLGQERLIPHTAGSIGALFRHVLGHALKHPLATAASPGPLNILIVVSNQGATSFASHPRRLYQRELLSALKELAPGRAVRLQLARVQDLAFPGGEVHVNGVRYHAVIEQNDTEASREIFRSFKAGQIHCYTSPHGMVLGDKRWLALLSSQSESPLFTDEERALIRRAIPWTREVSPRATVFRGLELPLPKLLQRHRTELVLKAGQGYGGAQVHVGRALPEAEWQTLVKQALEEGSWIAQEYLEPVMPVLQDGDDGTAPHRIVWGLMVFGETYGGPYLRLAPERLGAVVNVARGARVGLALEVAGG
ncbi:MAG: hypothetical protein SX243_18115 [Acidobacteriota bacterium]|nr:hypothetical protein [Acidobacteriota bacterium]